MSIYLIVHWRSRHLVDRCYRELTPYKTCWGPLDESREITRSRPLSAMPHRITWTCRCSNGRSTAPGRARARNCWTRRLGVHALPNTIQAITAGLTTSTYSMVRRGADPPNEFEHL